MSSFFSIVGRGRGFRVGLTVGICKICRDEPNADDEGGEEDEDERRSRIERGKTREGGWREVAVQRRGKKGGDSKVDIFVDESVVTLSAKKGPTLFSARGGVLVWGTAKRALRPNP